MSRTFVYDEFYERPLIDLPHWGYAAWRQLGISPWTLAAADRDLFNYIEKGLLYHFWLFEAPAPDDYYHHQDVRQGFSFDPDANPPLGDWTFTGIDGAVDVYSKVSLPATTTMTDATSGGGNFQFILQDWAGYFGTGLWVYHYDDVDSTWQWVLSSWVAGYDSGYEESAYIGLGTAALDIWVRLTWPLDGSEAMIYYALSEPTVDADWTELMPVTPYPFVPNGIDLPYLQMFSQGNSFNLSEDLVVTYEYFREWIPMSTPAPILDQYQRLQGYPKVTHPLVFNRNTGEFEVMEQPRPAAPSPTTEGPFVLAYDGSGNLSTITVNIHGISYVKTLTYTGGNLSGVSVWVEQ